MGLQKNVQFPSTFDYGVFDVIPIYRALQVPVNLHTLSMFQISLEIARSIRMPGIVSVQFALCSHAHKKATRSALGWDACGKCRVQHPRLQATHVKLKMSSLIWAKLVAAANVALLCRTEQIRFGLTIIGHGWNNASGRNRHFSFLQTIPCNTIIIMLSHNPLLLFWAR